MPANDVTLYAIYSKELSVKYHNNRDGLEVYSNTLTVTIWNNEKTGTVTLPKIGILDLWTPYGWRLDTTASATVDDDNVNAHDITIRVDNSVSDGFLTGSTLYAVHTKNLNLTFDITTNGGSGTAPTTLTPAVYYNISTGYIGTGNYLEATIDFPAVSEWKAGWTTLGWSNVSTDTTAKYAGGQTAVTLDSHATNQTFYAIYSIKTYYITYNGVAGTGFSGRTEYTIETDTFSISNPYKNGYMFNGWSAVTSGNLKIADPFNVSVPKGTYGNITFTANFGEFYLNATTNEGALTLEVVGGVDGNGYKYQFWMEGNSEYGSRYELVSENYQTSNSVTIASPASYQINGYYSAYVRVKLGNDIVAEFAGRYDISELHLGYKEIYVNNDRVLDTVYVSIEDGATIKVVVPSNSADKLEYSDGQTSGNTTTLVDGEYFEFNYKPSTAGYYKLKLTLSVNGTNRSSFYLNVVAFSEDSVYLTNTGYTVSGDTVTLNASMTTLGNATTKGYWIDYVVANGQRTANANAYKLRESGLYPYYIWLYGPNGTADWVEGIINYNAPSMSISVPSTEVGSSVVATASEVENAVRYWFRVYDASGLWTIQRTSSNSCTYTFSKAGIYRLEVMAESKSGIYISSSSIDVRVTGASVSNLSIDAPSSVNTFDVVNINALLSNVEDSDKTIYKYVIRGMNKYEELTPYYTTSSNRQHVFTKPGTYTIEVRIMHKDSYGMYDATAYHTITVS